MNRSIGLALSCFCIATACFVDTDPPVSSGTETETSGDGDGDPTGDGDGDPTGDGDGDPTGDGDGDPTGDGDGDPTGDGDGDGDGDPTGPMCNPEEDACGNECVNLDTDPAHCGACDHDCLGGECTAGVCEAVLMATGKGRLFMAQVDQMSLYYGGDGTNVGRIDKDGSNDIVLVPAGMDIMDREWCYDSAFTGDAVVWGNDWVQPGVRGCSTPTCDGGVQNFKLGMNLYDITFNTDNSKIYFTQGNNVAESQWPVGPVLTFAMNEGATRSLTNDGEFVYWATSIAAMDVHIRKKPVGGGNNVEFAINRPAVGPMVVGPNKLYWADNGFIAEAPLPNGIGGAAPEMFAPVGSLREMAIDGTHVYWTSQQDGVGTVGRCPHDGCDGPPQILMQVMQPWGIAVDQAAVFVVTEAGEIWRVAK
jgi:hypothetical protein